MADRFVASPDMANTTAKILTDLGGEFQNELKNVQKTVQEMIASDFIDPAAKTIARSIGDDLVTIDSMSRVMVSYGEYFSVVAKSVRNTQEDISASFR